jgi:hypothetical protein
MNIPDLLLCVSLGNSLHTHDLTNSTAVCNVVSSQSEHRRLS